MGRLRWNRLLRWKVLSEPLVCAICSLMTMTQLARGEAAVKSGRKWMVPNLSATVLVRQFYCYSSIATVILLQFYCYSSSASSFKLEVMLECEKDCVPV